MIPIAAMMAALAKLGAGAATVGAKAAPVAAKAASAGGKLAAFGAKVKPHAKTIMSALGGLQRPQANHVNEEPPGMMLNAQGAMGQFDNTAMPWQQHPMMFQPGRSSYMRGGL